MADLASALDHLQRASRISGNKNSYRKDNPGEYSKVMAYLDGGARPTGITTDMGLGLVEVEDVRRALVVHPPAGGGIYWGGIVQGDAYGGQPAHFANTPWPDGDTFGDGWGTNTMNLWESHTIKTPTCYGLHLDFAVWNSEPFDNAWNRGSFVVLTTGTEGTSIAGINSGSQDAAIDSFATNAATWGHPFMIRPWWEMNGDWGYPWQVGAGVTSAQYVSAWQRFYSRVNAIAHNVSFAWVPNIWVNGGTNPVDPIAYYPGDAYVDWVGLDGYNKGVTTQTFSTIYDFSYGQMTSRYTKPLGIFEVASLEYANSATKPSWITDMLTQMRTTYPLFKMFMWFNDNNGSYTSPNGPDSFPLECPDPSTTVATGVSLSVGAFRNGIANNHYRGTDVNSTNFPSGQKVPVP